MSKQANPVVIGGFVLGALALIVIAILVFSSGALFRETRHMVSYFPGTVQGLNTGARVEFQGVQVGQVTDISLEYYIDEGKFLIPVQYEIWPDHTKLIGPEYQDPKLAFKRLVNERGLRAKLESVSLVTGQYMIALSLQPDTPIRLVNQQTGAIEIPTVAAERDRLANMLKGLDLDALVSNANRTLDAIRALAESEGIRKLIDDGDQALVEARKLIADIDQGVKPLFDRIDSTLVGYSALAETANTRVNSLADSVEGTSEEVKRLADDLDRELERVSKSAVGALDQANKAFRAVDGLVGEGSKARYDLDTLLQEAAGAARSLRILADYLQQHPDALIKGN
jgi:paraquat-inducible protein B